MANVITGAKAKITINGAVVGYATGISIAENTLNGRVESLGYIDSREIVPISRNVQVMATMIRIFDAYVGNAGNGIQGVAGGDTDDNGFVNSAAVVERTIEDRTRDVLNKAYFDIQIIDSSSSDNKVIYTVKNCKISSQNIVVDRASLMGVQVMMDAEYLVRHEI
jgi:hypothetical protein